MIPRFGCITLLVFATGSAHCSAESVFETPVFISGTEGYHTYRIPALIVSKQGTLLAFCEGRKTSSSDHGDLDLVLRRSTDGGESWLPMQLVYEEGGDAKVTIGNPAPVVDQQCGRIWLPFCRDNDGVLVTYSDDDGKTWTKPREITNNVKNPKWGWYATGPGNGIQLQHEMYRGRLITPCDSKLRQTNEPHLGRRSHVIYSDDQGKTWRLGGATPDVQMNECAVVELSDGTLMLNMRSYRGKDCRAVATSRDGGITWSEAVDVPTLIEPVCQASLIGWRPANRPGLLLLFSNPASNSRRWRMTLRLSRDEGKTWPTSRLLYEGPSGYSCLAILPDGRIGCLYERGERNAYQTITLACFTLDWLTGGTEEK